MKHYCLFFSLINEEQLAKLLRRGNATIAKGKTMPNIYQRLVNIIHREKIEIQRKLIPAVNDSMAISKAKSFIDGVEQASAQETPDVFIIPMSLEQGQGEQARIVKGYTLSEMADRLKTCVEFLSTRVVHDPRIVM